MIAFPNLYQSTDADKQVALFLSIFYNESFLNYDRSSLMQGFKAGDCFDYGLLAIRPSINPCSVSKLRKQFYLTDKEISYLKEVINKITIFGDWVDLCVVVSNMYLYSYMPAQINADLNTQLEKAYRKLAKLEKENQTLHITLADRYLKESQYLTEASLFFSVEEFFVENINYHNQKITSKRAYIHCIESLLMQIEKVKNCNDY
jgi:hypothetical protein